MACRPGGSSAHESDFGPFLESFDAAIPWPRFAQQRELKETLVDLDSGQGDAVVEDLSEPKLACHGPDSKPSSKGRVTDDGLGLWGVQGLCQESLQQLITEISSQSPRTTLVMKHVPPHYTSEELLEDLRHCGDFDFLYLPCSWNNPRNMTSAFINFTSEAGARNFLETWHGKRLPRHAGRSPLKVSFAEFQGLMANVLRLRKGHFVIRNGRSNEPIVFQAGEPVAFTSLLHEMLLKVQSQNVVARRIVAL